jgi:hypothetical protein
VLRIGTKVEADYINFIMENKAKDRALDVPAEANRDKHMNYLAADDGDSDNRGNDDVEEARRRHDADSGNDSTNEMLQKEKLIDPGNEHTHRAHEENERTEKHDADAGGDGTGTMGSKPE